MAELLLHESTSVKTFLVKDSKWGQAVIKKVPVKDHVSEQNTREFRRELDLLNSLSIKGIQRGIGFDTENGKPALYYEYFDGFSIKQLIKSQHIGLPDKLNIIRKVAAVLAALHEINLIHKNINSHSILVNIDTWDVQVIDFSMANRIQDKFNHVGSPNLLHGNLHYISPEQTGRINRVVDIRSDLYSLGVVMYEILCGELPFLGSDPVDVVHAHLAVSPASFADRQIHVPDSVEAIVFKLLNKNVEDRYQSATGFMYDLDLCIASLRKKVPMTGFMPGVKDVSPFFRISQKLYGREREIAQLREKVDNIDQTGASLVLIDGYSGVGKTSLVHEVFREISFKNGYFIKGKYDQLQRNIPLFAIARALQDLITFISSESEEELAMYKTAILAAVGNEGGVVLEILPSLEHIIGAQPDVEPLSGQEAQNRFHYIFGNFIKAICRPEKPLVMFIDDLQWADQSSVQFITKILSDPGLKHLLLIGAYRHNEVGEGHPLLEMIRELEDGNISPDHLSIDNLGMPDVNALVADSLNLTSEEAWPLSEIIYSKTQGNAFHVLQVFRHLHDNGILYFDSDTGSWQWKSDRLEGINLSDNVVDLLIDSLNQLNEDNRKLLMTAACVGNSFSLESLELVMDRDSDRLYDGIIDILQSGYIARNNLQFDFLHDKIQQAAYSLIPEMERGALHLKIGEYLLEKSDQPSKDEAIFDIVNQVNKGMDLVADHDKREFYASLNYRAAVKARGSSAYLSAMNYGVEGLRFSDKDWSDQYQLLIDLYSICAESAYLTGRFDLVEEYLAPLQSHARDLLDRILVYEIRIESLKSQNKLREAIEVGIDALAQLGTDIPRNPGQVKIMQKLIQTRISLIGKNTEKLKKLAPLRRADKRAAIRLMIAIGPAIYWAAPELIGPLIFEMVMLSVKHGNSDESVFAYSTYALLLCGVTGEIESGKKFGMLALWLAERSSLKSRVKGIFNVYCFVDHWSSPIRDSYEPFKANFRSGLEAGDLEFSALSAYLYCNHQFYHGENLSRLAKQMEIYNTEIGQIKQSTPHNYLLIHWQAVKNLRGESDDPTVLSGSVYDENVMHDIHVEAKDSTALFKLFTLKMVLNYWMGRSTEAADYGEKCLAYMEAATGMLVSAVFWFYYGLVHAAMSEQYSRTSLNKLNKSVGKFRKWAKHAPWNHGQKLHMLLAEKARLEKQPFKASAHYQEAIKLASENQFVQDEGLANELAGAFYRSLGQEKISDFHLVEAFRSYSTWGAVRLADNIRYKYGLDDTLLAYPTDLERDTDALPGKSITGQIDAATIVKAATAISGDIENRKFNESMLKIVVQNAGAQFGYLVIKNGDLHMIEQSWPVHLLDKRCDFQQSHLVPKTVIHRVIQTGESLNVQNAVEDPTWKMDPYVLEHQVKSFFTLPVNYQGDLIGVIYLENNIAYGAFTSDRQELLEMLSGQIAVTIRNASLYSNLNDSLAEQVRLKEAYSKFVPRDALRFLGKESILDVSLGDQIQESVSIMFIDIKDYTQLSETMTPRDNFNFINGYLARVGPIIQDKQGFISQFLGDGFMAIFKFNPEDALDAAIKIQEDIGNYNEQRTASGRTPIEIGIGLHYGPVMMGIIGDRNRMDQNVISDHVNVASRVQGLTRLYDTRILITESIYEKVKLRDRYHLRELGRVVLKGKKEELGIIECLDGLEAESRNKKIQSVDVFGKGMESYFAQNFKEAKEYLQKVLKDNPGDKAAQFYHEKSTTYLNEGIGKGWTGAEHMLTK